MKLYIDDILIKRSETNHHIDDFEEVFHALSCYQMKLNLSKNTFKVTFGKFLDFIVTRNRIEVNFKKMSNSRHEDPTSKKEV